MNHFTLPRRAACAGLLALAAVAALAGCAKKVTSVDAGYTALEGRADANVQLLAWPDTPDTILVYADFGTPGSINIETDPPDTLYDRVPVYLSGPGVIHTILLDRTAASSFQFFRRANNGGLDALTDYPIRPDMKWLSTGWELYSLSDARPSGYSPATYAARGLLDGYVTTSSPLSNAVAVTGVVPRQSLSLRWTRVVWPGNPVRDTVLTFAPVLGAASYWLDIYSFTIAQEPEIAASGTPSPVVRGNVKQLVVANIAAGAAQYRVALPGVDAALTAPKGLPGWNVLLNSTPIKGQTVLVRVSAVDAGGNVIAWTRGSTKEVQVSPKFYKLIPYGSLEITAGKIPRPNPEQ